MVVLTDAQRWALGWLQQRNGTGLFDKTGVLVAGGDRAETIRSTWNKLRDTGLLTIDKKRVTLTETGRATDTGKLQRSPAVACTAPRVQRRDQPRLSDEDTED